MKNIVLIDFDGVIRQWPGQEVAQAEALLGIPQGQLYKCAFAKDLLNLAVCGDISYQQWCDRVVELLARRWGYEVAAQLVKVWVQAQWHVDTALLEGIRHYAPGSKLVLVTNGTSQLDADLNSASLQNSFDLVISSSDIGVAKPDRLFFEIALQLVGGSPTNALFIDDSEVNVAAAKAMGIDSHVYTNRDNALNFVRQYY